MKKENRNLSGESLKTKKHPVRQKFMAILLCVCLLLVSLPMEFYGSRTLAEGVQKKILYFSDLPQELRRQTVEKGTSIEELNLPKTLTAICISVKGNTDRNVEGISLPERNFGVKGEGLEEKEEPSESTVEGIIPEDNQAITDMNTKEEEIQQEKEEISTEGQDITEDSEAGTIEENKNETLPEEEGPSENQGEETPVGDGCQSPVDAREESSEISEPAVRIEPELDLEEELEIKSEETIENILWESEPKYNGEKVGNYIFTPILPENYILAEGVELPKINVSIIKDGILENDRNQEQKEREPRKKIGNGIDNVEVLEEEHIDELVLYEPKSSNLPSCGTVSEDTVWEGGTLADGELVIEPNVTLTINGQIKITGNVTLHGGGKILRGNTNAHFSMDAGANLTLQNILLEGNSLSSRYSTIIVQRGGKITLDDGCIIQNCGSPNDGGAIYLNHATANLKNAKFINCSSISSGGAIYSLYSQMDINGTVFENCFVKENDSYSSGGAIYTTGSKIDIRDAVMTGCHSGYQGGAISSIGGSNVVNIYSGTYSNNSTTDIRDAHGFKGGGCIYNCTSTLNIYGGNFIGNVAANKGGFLNHCGENGTITNIFGGVFEGNRCDYQDEKGDYRGSGGIFNSSVAAQFAELTVSGNAKFVGDGNEESGVDGIYLDQQNNKPRKIFISSTLTYPVKLYVSAIPNYVIAEGKDGYVLLKERDMKKITFFDIGDSGKKWYPVLDSENNQIKVSEVEPNYAYYVYYINNGAEGIVEDDNPYQIGDTAKVKPADNLIRKGYTFQEWNTQENGKGTGYQPDDELEIKGDTDLYAIFLENEKREFVANFYSGSTCNKETYSEVTDKEEKSVTTVAKEPQEMEGWNFIGWEEDNPSGYGGAIQPDSEIVLKKDRTEYYGIYQKEITLSYMAEGIDNIPVEEKNTYFANVSNQISYKKKEFTIAPALTRDGYTFAGWNTKPDGTGDAYEAGSKQTFMEDTTLYAVFLENGKKEFMSDFYSGGEGQKETVRNVVEESETSVEIIAPELKELPGWTSLGWCKDASAYQENIVSGSKIGQNTEHASYYGIYRKNVVLSYDANGGENGPMPEEKVCYANVHGEITYDLPEFTIAPALTRDGYTFTGWNTKPDGTGDAYEAGSKETFMEDTVLYAMFLENGKKEFTADFYSGGENLKETIKNVLDESEESVEITVPELKELPGWVSLGWNMDESSYTESIASGSNVEQTTEQASFYGIYRQKIILSYDANGGEHVPVQEEKFSYANVHGKITYELPEFTIAPAITRTGYDFMGWNTKADGSGEDFKAGSIQKIDSSLVLYAVWEENHDVAYKVEHYKQDLEGDGYTMDDAATETFFGKQGTEVEAKAKDYVGFAVNLSHSLGKPKGTVKADGSLVLKLYYDRDVYEVDFNLNGGYGKTPDTQKIRYGGFLKTVESPNRAGYHFKGWHLDDNGLDGGLWDFKSPVENNTGTLHTTLYAKWADELAPVMGKASFLTGHKDFLDWIIHKNSIIIMVPVVEEGSGLATAEYLLVAEDGTEKEGMAQIEEKHSLSDKTLAYGSSATMIRAIQAKTEQGAYETRIPIEEEFKGKVYLTCKDFAGNVSAQKELTAAGGGVIIEDNAPEISFSNTKEKIEKPINIKVSVKDDIENNVSGGIASITYQLDKKEKVSLPEKDFNQRMVESYKFAVKVSGIGKHTLRINAVDNAGNESEAKINLEITGKKETMVPVEEFPDSPNKPRGIEPKTGDNSHVKIYATVAMIAGFSYLLLYFQGENGITEQEKEEIVYRLVSWAKRGGTIRRMLGLAAIFFFLAYYHSIGKSVTVEWREVYKYQR